MDELAKVREFREAVPPLSDEGEESVRRGLRALAAGDRPAPGTVRRLPGRRAGGRLTPWVLPAGAIMAAGAVAGAVVLHDPGGAPRPPHSATAVPPTGAPKPFPDIKLASAVELGSRAAHAAERQPYRKPGPKQWVYTRAVSADHDMSTWWKGIDAHSRHTNEKWQRVDGGGEAVYLSGKLRVMPRPPDDTRNHTTGPLFNLSNYDTLPTTPGALLHRLSTARYPTQIGKTTAQDVFEFMEHILADPSPPKLRSAVYRALPKVDGVTLQKKVRDAAGRPGVAFARTNDRGERTSIILDPATYAYLGGREDVAYAHTYRPQDGKPFTTKPGTILNWYAQLTQKIVDAPGDRN